MLAEKLITTGGKFADAWNFGPEESDTKPVSWIADRLCSMIPNSSWKIDNKKTQRHETATLKLGQFKSKVSVKLVANDGLSKTAIDKTMAWYNSHGRRASRWQKFQKCKSNPTSIHESFCFSRHRNQGLHLFERFPLEIHAAAWKGYFAKNRSIYS